MSVVESFKGLISCCAIKTRSVPSADCGLSSDYSVVHLDAPKAKVSEEKWFRGWCNCMANECGKNIGYLPVRRGCDERVI